MNGKRVERRAQPRFEKDGKHYKEQAGYFVEKGLVVGNDENSTAMQSTEAMTTLLASLKEGKYTILAAVHTHPWDKGSYCGPSGEDTESINTLSPTKVGFVFLTNGTFEVYTKTGRTGDVSKTFYDNITQYGANFTVNFT